MRFQTLGGFALAALLLAGCATTPQSRIERDPASFSALTAEQQQKVRDGNAGVGFDEAAVRLALGPPDRVIEREAADGITQTWVYYALVPNAYGSGYCAPGFPYYGPVYYCQAPVATQYQERTRVLFKEGKVVSVESTR